MYRYSKIPVIGIVHGRNFCKKIRASYTHTSYPIGKLQIPWKRLDVLLCLEQVNIIKAVYYKTIVQLEPFANICLLNTLESGIVVPVRFILLDKFSHQYALIPASTFIYFYDQMKMNL